MSDEVTKDPSPTPNPSSMGEGALQSPTLQPPKHVAARASPTTRPHYADSPQRICDEYGRDERYQLRRRGGGDSYHEMRYVHDREPRYAPAPAPATTAAIPAPAPIAKQSYCNMTCLCARFFGICIVVGVVLWFLSYMELIQYGGPSINPYVAADGPSPPPTLRRDDDDQLRRLLEETLPKYLLDDIPSRDVKRMEPEDIKSVLRDLPLLKKMKALLEMRSNTNFVAHPELMAPEPLSFILWATNRKQNKQENKNGFLKSIGLSWPAAATKQEYEVVFMFNVRVAGESEETTPMVLLSDWRPQFFGPLEKRNTPKVIEIVYETIRFVENCNEVEIITMHRWFEMEEAADLLKLMELCRPKEET